MRKWTDELLVKCFAGKLTNQYFIEHKDVVEARLAYLEKNKRYTVNTTFNVYVMVHVHVQMSVCLSAYLPTMYLPTCTYLPVCLSVCLAIPVCLSVCLPTYLFVCLSEVGLSY